MTDHWHPLTGPGDEDDLLQRPTRSEILRTAHMFRRGFAMFSFLLTAVPTLGYLAGTPILYRPIPEEAGIPPLVLVALAALALAVLIQHPFARPGITERLLLFIGAAVPLGCLVWQAQSPALSPDQTMGVNTAVGILALASALALRRRRQAWPAIILAGAAGMICLSAFLGYAMGIGRLHGALSPVTLMILTPLVLATLIGQLHRPMLRTLLGSDRLTRMLRFELALAVVVPIMLAIAIFRLEPDGPTAGDAIYTQVIILFCCAEVLLAGRIRDRLDRERRLLALELQRASLIDPLTGLANRRGLMMMANHAIHAARRGGIPVALVICDLDHFKAINDRLGHGVGDRVLQTVSHVLSRRVRVSDIAGRWSGEEFLLVLPNTTLAGAEALAEILRHALADEVRIMPSGEIGTGAGGRALTASFGCAPVEIHRSDGFERALEAADRALLAAKRRGRNRVESESPALLAALG